MQNPMPDTQEIGIKEEGDLGGIRDDDGISELEQLLKQKTFTRKVLQTINMISFFWVNGMCKNLSTLSLNITVKVIIF